MNPVFIIPGVGLLLDDTAIPKPPEGSLTLFVRSDGTLAVKLSSGLVKEVGGGGGFTTPFGTPEPGTLFVAGGNGIIAPLPVGEPGQFLEVARPDPDGPSIPQWRDIEYPPALNFPFPDASSLLYTDHTGNVLCLPTGSIGQVLQVVDGGEGIPALQWITPIAAGPGTNPGGGTPPGGSGGGEQKLIGTPISSQEISMEFDGHAHPPSLAFDGDTASFFLSGSGVGDWLGLDLGAGVSKVLTKVRLWTVPQSSYATGWAKSANLNVETSVDSQVWTQVGFTGPTVDNAWNEYVIASGVGGRFVRVRNGHDLMCAAELELYGS